MNAVKEIKNCTKSDTCSFIEHKIGIYCRTMDATARVPSVVPSVMVVEMVHVSPHKVSIAVILMPCHLYSSKTRFPSPIHFFLPVFRMYR